MDGTETKELETLFYTQELSICSSKEFYNEETNKCDACGENMGTSGF